jgi:hypothetical protein
MQNKCFLDCETCEGWKIRVPGVCSRSPVRDVANELVGYGEREFSFVPQDHVDLPHTGIPVIASSFFKDGSAFHENTKVVGVGITSVLSRQGWFSDDVKDYLSLRKDQKLILITSALDDILESAWDLDLMRDPVELQKRGFDYWAPIAFSPYNGSSRMNQLFQSFRTLLNLEQCAAHYVPVYWGMMRQKFAQEYLKALETVPNAIFNAQFVNEAESKDMVMRAVAYFHKITPEHVTFSFIGATSLAHVMNFKSITKGRRTYFFSSTPWMAGIRGYTFTSIGTQIKDMSIGRIEVMRKSQANYIKMCDRRPEDYGL